jgi:hypothetical protein
MTSIPDPTRTDAAAPDRLPGETFGGHPGPVPAAAVRPGAVRRDDADGYADEENLEEYGGEG